MQAVAELEGRTMAVRDYMEKALNPSVGVLQLVVDYTPAAGPRPPRKVKEKSVLPFFLNLHLLLKTSFKTTSP